MRRGIACLAMVTMGLWIPSFAETDFELRWEPKRFAFLPGEPVTFDAVWPDDAPAMDVFWEFGDDDPVQGSSIKHTFDQSGLVEVKAYGMDASGNKTRDHFLLFVIQPEFADVNFDVWIEEPAEPMFVAQAGSTLDFRASSTEPVFFLWQLGDWGLIFEGAEFSWEIPGYLDGFRGRISLIGINDQGAGVLALNPWHQRELYVYRENQPPRTGFTPGTMTNNQTAFFRLGEVFEVQAVGQDPDGSGIIGFLWQLTGPQGGLLVDEPRASNTFRFDPIQPGMYQLSVYAIDGDEVQDPFGAHLSIDIASENRPPSGSFAFVSHPVIRPGETVQVRVTASDPEGSNLVFKWDPGDGRDLTTGRDEFSIAFDEPGAYPLALTVVDGEGGQSKAFKRWVLVNGVAGQDNQSPVSWIVAPESGAAFQAGEELDFAGWGYDPDGDELFYFWDFDDGRLAFGPSGSISFENPTGEQPWTSVYNLHLYTRDLRGATDYEGHSIPIAVCDGFTPPQGRIVLPDIPSLEPPYNSWQMVQLYPEERLTLKGDIIVPEDGLGWGIWRFIKLDEELKKTSPDPVLIASGLEPTPIDFDAFPQTGFYLVEFAVADSSGNWDPIPEHFLLWVREDIALPEVTILEPTWDRSLRVGQPFHLAAWGLNADDWDLQDYVQFLDLEFHWTLSDGRNFRGQRVEFITFDEPGLYYAILRVTNSSGESYQVPERRNFVVNPEFDPAVNLPPWVEGVLPPTPDVLGAKGSAHEFACQGVDAYGEEITAYLWDFGNGSVSTEQNPGPVQFDKPGSYLVRAYAQDASGYWCAFPNYWHVFIYDENVPPQGTIVAPELRDHDDPNLQHVIPILMGQDIVFSATAVDRDSPTAPTISWLLDGVLYGDDEIPRPARFSEAGEYLVQLQVTDDQGLPDPFADWRVIQVVDPEKEPESYIVVPDRELAVDPGRPLYFFGFGEDPNHLEMTYEWDFGPAATPSTATGNEVYPVIFNQESPPGEPFVVTFRAKTEFTQDATPDTVRVTVKQYHDSDFEPNNSFDEIAPINPGRYPRMRLGPEDTYDYFLFEITERSRDFEIELWTENPGEWVIMGFFGKQGEEWVAYAIEWVQIFTDTIRLQDIPRGEYAIVIALPDEMKKKADGLSYGIGLNTLQPSFYLPFLVEDGNLSSHIGIINPHDTLTDVAVVGLNAAGQTVASVSFAMAPHARIYVPSLSFFGNDDQIEKGRMIHWVKVLSTQRLVGFMNSETQDKRQLMSTPSITALTSTVLVPHVAEKTDQWYTRAVVVNADETSHQVSFRERSGIQEIASPAPANTQEDFLFTDLYEDNLPTWGEFFNDDGQACLAGIEMFGRTDGNAMMAGLEMVNPKISNPNFLSVANTIFFPHIASDVDQFWTGISMINPSDQTATCNILAFDDAGEEIGRITGYTLEPGGKLLATAAELFPDVTGISWIKVVGDADLAGFELFGDHQNKRLAGLKALTYGTDQLFFPHVQNESNRTWTGISVLNFGDEAATAHVRAYTDQGFVCCENEFVLQPQTKLVATIEELFPGQDVPPNVSYIHIASDKQTLNGFEIFGTLNPDGSLGEQMAGLGAVTP